MPDLKPITPIDPIVKDSNTYAVEIEAEVEELNIGIDAEVSVDEEEIDAEVTEEINVTVIQGTDVSDTTAIEEDVSEGKVFYKADGTRAIGTYAEFVPDEPNDVNFIDFDGTIVKSYSASEFANLTALPANPVHDGLTAKGWNWTLADAKAQVLLSKCLDIGQVYNTSDGKTRIYISLTDPAKLSPTLYYSQTVASSVSIDWGDGSAATVQTGTGNKNATHTYAKVGDYVITLTVSSGKLGLGNGSTSTPIISSSVGGSSYKNAVKNVEIGSGVDIKASAFYQLYSMRSVTIPNTIASIGNNVFYGCGSLATIIIPSGCTSLGQYAFRYNYVARHICLPKSVTTFSTNVFEADNSATRIILGGNITAITASLFNYNYGATKVYIPSSVTSIAASAFGSCTGLAEIHFKPATPPTVANSNAWTGLPTNCKIYVPSGYKSAYTSASNYPSSSTYTYVEE